MSNRILFVARSTSSHSIAGGMERAYEEVASALSQTGMHTALLTTHGFSAAGDLPPYERIWTIKGGKAGRYSPAWWLKTLLHRESWRDWHPDMIFSVSSAAASLCLYRSVSRKTMSQCHGTALAEVQSSLASPGVREIIKLPVNLLRILRELFAYRSFGRVLAIGPAVKDQLSARPLSLPASRTVTINNGVDEDQWVYRPLGREKLRGKLGIPADACTGVFAARLHIQKGADIAIRALALTSRAPAAHLILCGDGPDRKTLERLARELGVSDRVHFLGRLPQTSLVDALSAADVFIFPSRRREGLPLNLLEAFANGLEAITVANANVPTALRRSSRTVSCNDEAVAAEWEVFRPSDDRSSKLSFEFTRLGSTAAYLAEIRAFIAQSRENQDAHH